MQLLLRLFSSTFIVLTTPLLVLAYGLCLILGPDFSPRPLQLAFKGDLWVAILVLFVGEYVLTAIALAASTRLGQVLTLVTTVGFFVLGLLSDRILGRRLAVIDQTMAALVDAGGPRTSPCEPNRPASRSRTRSSRTSGLLARRRDHAGRIDPAGLPRDHDPLRPLDDRRRPRGGGRPLPATRGRLTRRALGLGPLDHSQAAESTTRFLEVRKKPRNTG